MASQTLRVACIGAGYFSQFHIEAWRRLPGAVPVAIVDQDLDRANATGLPAFQDVCSMLDQVRPDMVDIITPPHTHLEMIKAAIASKPKAIICQKPFCSSLDEARQMAALSTDNGVPIVIHENFRFQPWYRLIRDQIEKGHLGDVLQLTFRLRPGDGQGPRAYLDRQPYFQTMGRFLVHETAVHWVDVFRFLMGAPEAVFADLRTLNPVIAGEDAGHILFQYSNGARALFDGNRLLDHSAENTRCTMGEALVEGTKATLELYGNGSVHRRVFGSQDWCQISAPSLHAGFGGDCVYALQSHVIAGLNGQGALENTVEDYLPVIEQENAIYASAEQRRVITL